MAKRRDPRELLRLPAPESLVNRRASAWRWKSLSVRVTPKNLLLRTVRWKRFSFAEALTMVPIATVQLRYVTAAQGGNGHHLLARRENCPVCRVVMVSVAWLRFEMASSSPRTLKY